MAEFDPNAAATIDYDNLEVGDHVWIKAVVTSIDSDNEVYFETPREMGWDEENERETEEVNDTTSFSAYVSALKHSLGNSGEKPIGPGDVVYSQNSPGTFGQVKTLCKGQALIDWDWENPQGSAALSVLSVGILRRRGE